MVKKNWLGKVTAAITIGIISVETNALLAPLYKLSKTVINMISANNCSIIPEGAASLVFL